MALSRAVAALSIILLVGACDRPKDGQVVDAALSAASIDSVARALQDSINRTLPGYVVDSILPLEEELRRFRLAVAGHPVKSLRGGSSTREGLIRRFIRDLIYRDSSDLRTMLVDAREFADLVYPESPYTHPPYRQAPALVWNQIQNPSRSGLTRLVRRVSGEPLSYAGSTCDRAPDRQGRNVIWTGCVIRLVDASGEITPHRFFGSIIERGGQFKFVSYVNEF